MAGCGLTQSLQSTCGSAMTPGLPTQQAISPGLGFDRSRVRPWVADMEPEAVQTRRGGTSEIGHAEQVVDAGPSEGEGRQGSAEEVLELASLSAHLLEGRIPCADGSAD
jgi:hypothetical protein